MPADPTPPPVPAEALEAAEFEFCQRFAVASNPEAMTAFRAALAAAAVPLVAAGRTAAAADLDRTIAALNVALHYAKPTKDPASVEELGGCRIALEMVLTAIAEGEAR